MRETLGRLAALEATLAGLIAGQIQSAEAFPASDALCPNRRFVYAALNWCTESNSAIIDQLREFCGGGVFQMPADISVLHEPGDAAPVRDLLGHPADCRAVERMKLFKLAWDLVGSEFAGRHQQYEKFYAGASFVVRNYSHTHADWARLHAVVDGLAGELRHAGSPLAFLYCRMPG